MKNILIIIAILFSINTFAQIEIGSIYTVNNDKTSNVIYTYSDSLNSIRTMNITLSGLELDTMYNYLRLMGDFDIYKTVVNNYTGSVLLAKFKNNEDIEYQERDYKLSTLKDQLKAKQYIEMLKRKIQ